MLSIASLLVLIRSTATSVYTAKGDFALVVGQGAIVLAAATALSVIAVLMGAGPLALAAITLAVSGVGALVYVLRDLRKRYSGWIAGPAMPDREEFRQAARHVKWLSLQIIAPAVWLQVPVLTLNAWRASGHEIAAFLLLRTMVNLVRLFFQFAASGAGVEIASEAHRGNHARAWSLSARVGLTTCVLCAASSALLVCFGGALVLRWTGDETLFSLPMSIAMLAPLLLVAPLQQPLTLLQFSNRSLAPGLQKLLLAGLVCAFSVAGQALCGVMGLVTGLAVAEILASWSIAPMLAAMPVFTEFGRYCARALAATAGALGLCLAAGLSLNWLLPSNSAGVLVAKLGIWTAVSAMPLVFLTLPEQIRAALTVKVHAVSRAIGRCLASGRKT